MHGRQELVQLNKSICGTEYSWWVVTEDADCYLEGLTKLFTNAGIVGRRKGKKEGRNEGQKGKKKQTNKGRL